MTIDLFSLKNEEQKIISLLVDKYGVPDVRKDMAIYYKNESNIQIHLRFRNKKCLVLLIDPDTDDIFRPKIHIDTTRTSIKSLLLFFKKMGFTQASVGLATCFSFYNRNGTFIEVMRDTFIGNFVQVGYEDYLQSAQIIDWLKSMKLTIMGKDQLRTLIKDADVEYDEAINDLNVVNSHIYTYSKEIGLDIEMPDRTLKSYLQNFNNDYTYIEHAFEKIFRSKFLGSQGVEELYCKHFAPLSIIIPCYNSGETYVKTLHSINSQNLHDDQFKNLDVILVDDGSDIPVKSVLDKAKLNLKFSYQVLRLDPNSGLASARNAGLSIAKNQIIVFLDSDVVLSKNYLFEHSLRNSLIPNAIFVSFKQNVDPANPLLSERSILEGLNTPNISNDLRVRKIIQDHSLGLYEISGKMAVEILGATNYFKDLSYGRSLGIYDLPSMVVGHNMSCRKENILAVGGFSNNFKGWGMEDSYLGAKMIAEGNFIIPILSCGVYHIDHPPRSGSEEKKKQELELNLLKYKELLSSNYIPSINQSMSDLKFITT